MSILIQSRPSNGARVLRAAIREDNVRCLLRRRDATSRLRRSSMLINWGNSSCNVMPHLNQPSSVAMAVDKRQAFRCMSRAGVSVPAFLTNPPGVDTNVGESIWLERFDIAGYGGRGINVVRPGEKWSEQDAPLYVHYIPKLLEFRVHVFNTCRNSTLVRQKLGVEGFGRDRNQRLIRNTDNGYVLGLPRDEEAAALAEEEACKAVAALGLHFGAVDTIIGRDDGRAYVLEVNTAPGICSQAAVDFYKEGILRCYQEFRAGLGLT